MKLFILFLVFVFIGVFITYLYIYISNQLVNINPINTTHFSLINAPIESLKAKIISFSGTVDLLSRTATVPSEVNSNDILQQGETLTTKEDGKITFTIGTNSSISLFPNSDVHLIQLLPANFVITQDKGTVTYTNNGKYPLSIIGEDLLSTVVQGTITVSVDSDAQTVSVNVLNGSSTEAYEDLQNNSSLSELNSGYSFLYNDSIKQGTVQ